MDVNLLSSSLFSSPLPHSFIPLLPKGVCAHSMTLEVSSGFRDKLLAQGMSLGELNRKAVLRRQCEYLAGRYCAKVSLQQWAQAKAVGLTDFHVGTGQHREPLWPEGVLGSITHSNHYAMAVVTDKGENYAGIGVDMEELVEEDFAPALAKQIMNPAELAHADIQDTLSFRDFVTLVFSAKEALFKALFPTVNTYLGFEASELIALDSQQQRLTFRIPHALHSRLPTDTLLTVQYTLLPASALGAEPTFCCLALV